MSSKNKYIRKFSDFLLAPFTEQLPFFIILSLLLCIPSLFTLIHNDHYVFSAYLFAVNILECYLFTLPLWLLPNKILRGIYKALLIIYGVIWCVLVLFCIDRMHNYFSIDLIPIILGTNYQESCEFLSSCVRPIFIVYLLIYMAISFAVYFAACKLKIRLSRGVSMVALGLLAIFVVMTAHNSVILADTSISRTKAFVTYKAIKADQLIKNPNIISDKEKIDHIVIIIGESFSKSHSSLYGYDKPTNPRLESLRDSANLWVYDSVTAAYPATIYSFQRFMSTYDPQTCVDEWYNYPTLPEIVKKGGYGTRWISNQGRFGAFDNSLSLYASLCDTAVYIGDQFAGIKKSAMDEEAVDALKSVKKGDAPNVTFVHLMGSHPAFSARYPKDRVKWGADDYLDKPENQRLTLSEYDNSVLYNDSIVAEIMDYYKDEDAAVIYFSDHALDIFESAPDFCGHGVPTDPVSLKFSSAIPMVIYITDNFKAQHPDLTSRISHSTATPLNTKNVIYTIMDVAGLRFGDNDDVAQKTLLK